jgi:uncharacterized protein (DUF885 family)
LDPHDAAAGVSSAPLQELLWDHWETRMRWYPVWATRLGDHRYDDRLEDRSVDAYTDRRDRIREELATAEALDVASMTAEDRLTLRLFIEDHRHAVAGSVCRFEEWRVSARGNPLVEIGYLPEIQPFSTRDEAAALLARYRAIPGWVDSWIDTRRVGLTAGRVANAESVRRALEQVRTELGKPSAEWSLSKPTQPPEGDVPDPIAAERKQAADLVDGEIRAAFERWATFLEREVSPAARPADAVGMNALPGGEACYAALVRKYTTLERTPDELHRIGLEELTRIHEEFRVLGARVLGVSEPAEVFARLRDDPALRFRTSEEVEAKAVASVARAVEAQNRMLTAPPAAECVVRRVPDYEAPFTTIAYYRRPAPDGSKPGEYFVNVHAPETRPRFEAEVLAFHEGIPGHHLQIAVAQGLTALPAFRRNTGATAFVEGWGLYSERMADELGLYSGDLDRLGMLSFDAWRASRLVVDTGIHTRGWTRSRARKFLETNTPLALNNIDNEVDRYITTPGQALAYKTGQLEIRRLRAMAEQRLGEAFDLRRFHDAVLENGAVPLPVLAERIEAWLVSQ